MDKLKMQSPDLVEENIDKIAELFPNCVTEDRDENGEVKRVVDFDMLRQELTGSLVEGPRERYTLTWPGKNEAILTANAPIAKTLRPNEVESVDFENTKNLFIEGDNLDVLKLLQETYLSKVKMIYIDPPYNTGKDFIYKDDFSEEAESFLKRSNQKDDEGSRLIANTESNGRFHSDWICMMYPRLKLARNLLRDDGVIFISIDDNEVHNLRKICDEIFGEQNFVAVVSNTNNPKGRSDDKFIATAHEYICILAKDISRLTLGGFEPGEKITKRYNKVDDQEKKYREMDLRKTGDADRREDRPQMYYYFYYNEDTRNLEISKTKRPSIKKNTKEIVPLKDDGSDGRWRWGFDTAQKQITSLTARYMPNRKIWGVFEMDYLENRSLVTPTSSWTHKDVNSERGSEQFIELGFNKEIFPRPKPIGTMERLLRIGIPSGEESTILDFFSGSCTTAHAIMQLNAKENGNSKFIMVQAPEPCDMQSEAFKAGFATIAEIGKERIRRAGKKIKGDAPLITQNLDIGFRVFKLDTSNMKDVYYTPDALKQGNLDLFKNHIKPDRSADDLLFQVFLDWGLDLALPITKETIDGKTVFFVDTDALLACFDSGISEDLVKKLAKRKPLRAVFRDDAFGSDSAKINVEQIFKTLSPSTEVKSI